MGDYYIPKREDRYRINCKYGRLVYRVCKFFRNPPSSHCKQCIIYIRGIWLDKLDEYRRFNNPTKPKKPPAPPKPKPKPKPKVEKVEKVEKVGRPQTKPKPKQLKKTKPRKTRYKISSEPRHIIQKSVTDVRKKATSLIGLNQANYTGKCLWCKKDGVPYPRLYCNMDCRMAMKMYRRKQGLIYKNS